MSYNQRLIMKGLQLIALTLMLQGSGIVHAGTYLESAHGSGINSGDYGVNRPSMTGYAKGNCGHCHEMHASLAGEEPDPVSGVPNAYTLFAKNFNTALIPGSYDVTHNFCFQCHSGSPDVQQYVANNDYSNTFGGGSTTSTIMATFNQASFHNLEDIHEFVNGNSLSPWYTDHSNPCNGCHNPHLAKRNYPNGITPPLSSAISKPGAHFSLWGETQLMSTYSGGGAYIPPYSKGTAREPYDSFIIEDGSTTPNYVEFCMDCHNSSNITSTTLGPVRDIDWSLSSLTGEKHGSLPRDGLLDIREPYFSAQANSNFVLSCLDCHEPHGSPNIMLLRQRVNGESTIDPAAITTTDNMSHLCKRCHTDDAEAQQGTKTVNKWKYVHHYSTDAPYDISTTSMCGKCHGVGGTGQDDKNPIPCGNCHFHGSDDSWLGTVGMGAYQTDRKTF
jgi:hypothetical protein